MDLHLFEPEELPRPREEMRFEHAEVEPYPDGRRVRVMVGWTAFRDRPSMDAAIVGPAGETVTSFSVIEAMAREMAFTLHMRGAQPGPGYRLRLSLYYGPSTEEREAATARQEEPREQVVDTREVPFAVPAPGSRGPEEVSHGAD